MHTRLIVDEKRLRATLYRDGRRVWTSIVGVGAPGTPTPKGHFYIREKLTGYASPFYGPVALGTSDYSTLSEWPKGGVVGIHGTDEPSILPGRVSHGCVRVPNAAVLRLARITPIGTPILIR
ncbi:MAG: L,D-transpeptidase [Gaiellaceae bacterium]